MTIRIARYSDIPRMLEIYQDAHERSIYAENVTIQKTAFKQLMARSMQRHGQHNEGGTFMLVSADDNSGEVHGFMVGLLDTVYPCTNELLATDLLFLCQPEADPYDAPRMVRALMRWAEKSDKVIEIRLGVTGAVGDWERTSKLYTRLGMEPYGAIFRRGLDNERIGEERKEGLQEGGARH